MKGSNMNITGSFITIWPTGDIQELPATLNEVSGEVKITDSSKIINTI